MNNIGVGGKVSEYEKEVSKRKQIVKKICKGEIYTGNIDCSFIRCKYLFELLVITKSGKVYLSNDVVYGKAPLFDPERDIIYKFSSIVSEDISSLEGNYVVDC